MREHSSSDGWFYRLTNRSTSWEGGPTTRRHDLYLLKLIFPPVPFGLKSNAIGESTVPCGTPVVPERVGLTFSPCSSALQIRSFKIRVGHGTCTTSKYDPRIRRINCYRFRNCHRRCKQKQYCQISGSHYRSSNIYGGCLGKERP